MPLGFVPIEPGRFPMGSPEDEPGREDGEVQHEVTLSRAFSIKATEVTQGEWWARMRTRPWLNDCSVECPVESVSWYDTLAYCNALSLGEGLEPCYVDAGGEAYDPADAAAEAEPMWPGGLDCPGYRLPTEAEWEYAARAGTGEASYNGPVSASSACEFEPALDPIAWFCGNGEPWVQPVARKRPNAWGLYDMLGNASEWVWDGYGAYAGDGTDPTGPGGEAGRVTRGGSSTDGAPNLEPLVRTPESAILRCVTT